MRNKNFWKTAVISAGCWLTFLTGSLTAFAAEEEAAESGSSTLSMLLSTFGLPILLLVFLYFIMLRPQMKQDKETKAMRSNLQIGDEIVTSGGIVGIILRIEEQTDTVILETGSDRLKIRLLREAIVRNVTATEQAEAEKEAKKKAKLSAVPAKEKKDE